MPEVNIWRKNYNRKDTKYQWRRELEFLATLHPYHGFPKVLNAGLDANGEEFIDLTHCGLSLGVAYEQGKIGLDAAYLEFRALLRVMKHEGIKHRDLCVNNLLWHPEHGCHIVDFGIAIWFGEPDVPPAYLAPCSWGIGLDGVSDELRLRASIHQLKTGEIYTETDWRNGKEIWSYDF